MNWKKWNLLFISWLIILLFATVIPLEYGLRKLNESMDITASVKMQSETDALYGRVLIGQDYVYKLLMAKKQKADLLALGSSRVMEFRKECFTTSFYNAGGVAPTATEGLYFITELLQEYRPKVIIYGIDLWWLNPNFKIEVHKDRELLKDNYFYNRLFLYGSLLNEIDSREIQGILRGPHNYYNRYDPVEHRKAIGLIAALRGNGFRSDGSYQYGTVKIDTDFSAALESIKTGTGRFPISQQISLRELDIVRQTIQTLKANGVEVILLAPPFPHKVYEELTQSTTHASFLRDFRAGLSTLATEQSISFFDFTDLASTGAGDTEVIDGLHASEKAYGRMVKLMAADSVLSKHVNTKQIDEFIQKSKSPVILVPRSEHKP